MDETVYDLKPVRKTFSRVGLSLCVILLTASLLQILLSVVVVKIGGQTCWLLTSSWGMWLVTFVPMYLIAMPLGILILKTLPGSPPEPMPLKWHQFLTFLPICFFFTYTGSYIGTFLSFIFSGGQAENALNDFAMDNNPLKILVMVILAPLLEEFICRKLIIDRTRQYGEKLAVLMSATLFALFHGNLFQFFYAFASGMIFAYIYIRTGRLRYCVILHACINFMGSVVAPLILSMQPNLENTASLATADMFQLALFLVLELLFLGFVFSISLTGLILLILRWKKTIWKDADSPLPQGMRFRPVLLNAGMILFVLLCLISMILSLF